MSGGKASGNQAVQYTLVDDMPGVEGPVYETFPNFAAEGMQVPQSAVAAALEKLDGHQWGKMGKSVVPTQGIFTMPQQQLHSMAQGPSAVSAGGDSDHYADRATRMSLENEDAQLHGAIEASLQDGSGKQAGEGSVVASRATAEVHASGHTHTKSMCLPAAKQARGKGKTEADKVPGYADAMTGYADAMTQPLLVAGEHVFVEALREIGHYGNPTHQRLVTSFAILTAPSNFN